MKNEVLLYETGKDENRDRHCDLCGWFVNRFQNHRARRIVHELSIDLTPDWEYEDRHLDSMTAEEFSDYVIKDNPYARRDWDPNEFAEVLQYSENNDREISCKVINEYLRDGKIDEAFSREDIEKTIEAMNSEIDKFKIGWGVTLYRGIWFEPGDEFLGMLDDCLETMDREKKPAVFAEKGFMSTTRSVETAEIYARSNEGNLCHVYMSVTAEQGVSAMPLSASHGTAANTSDKEVLFKSGQSYYIIGMKRKDMGEGRCDYYINILATDRRI